MACRGGEPWLWSALCAVDGLFVPLELGPDDGCTLDLSDGWAGRWTVAWNLTGAEVWCPVSEITGVPVQATGVPVQAAEPARHFGRHLRQGRRAGLELLDAMGSRHGFEGLEEQKFLRVLDFAGAVRGVVSQSLRLRFTTVGGRARSHIPDCLVVMPGGRWLVDVRPVHLAVKAEDRAAFAAAREVAIDLRVITALIFMAWPATGIRAATPELARALGEEARQRQLDYVERSAVPGKQASATTSYSDPPAPPLVAAAVFEMADRLLRSPDESAASATLGPPAAEARYVSRKVGYSIRRGPGTPTALQTVLLAHRP